MGARRVSSLCDGCKKQQEKGKQAAGARALTQPKACHEIPLPRLGR